MKKIKDYSRMPTRCAHPEHNPPNHIVLSPGVWEHKCPGCGGVVRIHVHPSFRVCPCNFVSLKDLGPEINE